MENHGLGAGWIGSLRGFADGVVGSIQDRLRLLAVELQEEKFRLVEILLWIAAIVGLGFLAVIFASLVLVFVFWETARLPVIVGLAVAYISALITVVIGFRRYLARQPKPFAATLNELQEDRECFRAEN